MQKEGKTLTYKEQKKQRDKEIATTQSVFYDNWRITDAHTRKKITEIENQ